MITATENRPAMVLLPGFRGPKLSMSRLRVPCQLMAGCNPRRSHGLYQAGSGAVKTALGSTESNRAVSNIFIKGSEFSMDSLSHIHEDVGTCWGMLSHPRASHTIKSTLLSRQLNGLSVSLQGTHAAPTYLNSLSCQSPGETPYPVVIIPASSLPQALAMPISCL